MKGIATIWRKEMQAYFLSPMAYVFMGLFLAGGGLFFIRYNLMAMSADFAAVLSNMAILFLFAVPVLTMRLFSEERRNKTDQLLLTSPVSVTSVVLGKYFAALTMFACTLVVMLIYVAVLYIFGNPSGGEIFAAYLGFALLGAALIALGMFMSSMMENQVTTAFATLGVMLALYLMNMLISQLDIPWVITILKWLSVFSRFATFYQGMLTPAPIVYYLSFAALFVFLTVRAVEKRRWSEG